MATTSTWLNSFVLGAALVLAGTACAQEASCPSYEAKKPLTSVVVFDGPPEEMADLMPDVSKGSGSNAYASWDVGYIYDAGRTLFLVCRYGSTQPSGTITVTLKVEKRVAQCVYRSHSGKPAEARCK